MNNTSNNTTIIIVVALAALLIGFMVGRATAVDDKDKVLVNTPNSSKEDNLDVASEENNTEGTGEVETSLGNDANETAFTISMDSLPTAQQLLLKGMGISGDTLVITKGTVACAEAKMGEARVAEIKNGSSVTVGEGSTLVGCYNAN